MSTDVARVGWEVWSKDSPGNSMYFPTRRAAEEFVGRQFTVEQQAKLLLARNGRDEDWIVRDFARRPVVAAPA